MQYAIHLISSGKAENAVQVTNSLQDIKNQPISSQTMCHHLKKAAMKAVVKKKSLLLSKHHRKEHMDFALRH